MRKKILIIADTNVYGWYQDYTKKGVRTLEAINSFIFLSKSLEERERIEIIATETIEKEIKRAGLGALTELFYSVAKGVIKNTEKVRKLSNEYFEGCKKENLHFVDLNDCEIVAAATLAGVKLLVTENRKSLNIRGVKKVFDKINGKKNLRSVEIKNCKEAIEYVF